MRRRAHLSSEARRRARGDPQGAVLAVNYAISSRGGTSPIETTLFLARGTSPFPSPKRSATMFAVPTPTTGDLCRIYRLPPGFGPAVSPVDKIEPGHSAAWRWV